MGRYEGNSLKVLTLVNHLHCFDSRLNRFYTPYADGPLRKQLFKVLILVNHFCFTTCGWATFKLHFDALPFGVGYSKIALQFTRLRGGLS
jgi:hypothetical protein